MTTTSIPGDTYVQVAALDDVRRTGVQVVSSGRHGLALFFHDGQVYAVDNRCPHMGFPLSRGSCHDGILTCHWHHARFDLQSGGTFDPFADDVRVYPTAIRDGMVWVDLHGGGEDWRARQKRRLEDGLEQNLSLVMVKAVLALLDAGVPPREILEIGGRFGTRYRAAGWGPGLTILTALANVLDDLAPEDRALALYHGLVHTANDCEGQPPRFSLDPLPTDRVAPERLKSWFRGFVEVRDTDGAERALLTAIAAGLPPSALADMLFAAATDHYFLAGGHTVDFINKACEQLDHTGWEQAAEILPSLLRGLTMATRSEEQNAWRHPRDLVALLDPLLDELPRLVARGASAAAQWATASLDQDEIAAVLVGDDPAASVAALRQALELGAPLTWLSQTLCYAAALRVARFHTSNEFGDWITVLHTFTYCNALHQGLKRAPSAELARGIFHGAMKLYLDRFLNMPAARLPDDREVAGDGHETSEAPLLDELRHLLDVEQQVNPAGALVWRYLRRGHDPARLIGALGHVLLREDGEFHSYQMLEAGIALYKELRGERPEAAGRVLVAVARYLAAHAPTSRAMLQTARTAVRLHRGDEIYVSEEA
ncbi:MAG TPA: Rieske (2Fe-2S) protein [Chloroflexota bacterium]|nr:Rieske (2Fe-2S) protein [Chloroflexota bacterium]